VLWQALQKVKLHYRTAVYLRYFLDLSEAEMAEILGVAQGTVKSRLHRAFNQLREIIEGEYAHLNE
jgi:RNA polymerase sigma-70 factor (ECF subfamily)